MTLPVNMVSELKVLLQNPKNWPTSTFAELQIQDEKWAGLDLSDLTAMTESQLLDQLKTLSYLMIWVMQKENRWGDAGREQILHSFCRCVLNIPHEVQLSGYHFEQFETHLASEFSKRFSKPMTLDHAKKMLSSFQFQLWDVSFPMYDILRVSKTLRFLGSTWVIQGGYYGLEIEIVLGTGKVSKRGDYELIVIENEIFRTPNVIMAMAAVIGDRQVFVRNVSLSTLFYIKWKPVWFSAGMTWDRYAEFSQRVKQRVIRFYANSPDEFELKKETFLDEMGETILFHELGHAVIQHHLLPPQIAGFSESTKVISENLVTALLECLADWAPSENGLHGPLWNMVQVSEKDPEKATRQFWMYVSDTWFFDTPDEYMYLYSGFMAASLFSVVDDNSQINWSRLKSLLDVKNSDSYTHWAINWVHKCLGKLNTILEKSKFEKDGKTVSFDLMKHEIDRKVRANIHDVLDETDYKYQSGFWAFLMEEAVQNVTIKESLDRVLETLQSEAIFDFQSRFLKKGYSEKLPSMDSFIESLSLPNLG